MVVETQLVAVSSTASTTTVHGGPGLGNTRSLSDISGSECVYWSPGDSSSGLGQGEAGH